MPGRWLVANAVWLQAGWWICVLGAERPWLLLLVIAGVVVHLRLCPDVNAEVKALLRVTLAGCVLDSTRWGRWACSVSTPGRCHCGWRCCGWCWPAACATGLAWAGRHWQIGALIGALGGPLAYVGGARVTQVALPLGTLETGLLLMPIWALALPLLARLAARR